MLRVGAQEEAEESYIKAVTLQYDLFGRNKLVVTPAKLLSTIYTLAFKTP
jgi:hypothetical protein